MCFTLAGLFALALAPGFAPILLAVALIGWGSSIFHPESSRVAQLASGGRKGLAQSIFQVGGNAGSAFGPLLAALVVIPYGQTSIMWFAPAALLAIGILLRIGNWYKRQLNAATAAPVTATAAAAELPRRKIRRALLILTVLVFSKYFYIACMTNYFTFFLMDKFAFSVQDAQYSLFAFLAASAAGTVIGGPLGDRIGRKYVIWGSILGAAPFALMLPYAGSGSAVALAILVGSSVARCTLAQDGGEAGPDPVSQEQASPQEAGRGDEEEDAGAAGGAPKGFSALAGSSWTSEDGGSSLSITPTNLVVTSPEGTTVLYYALDEESSADGSLSATLSVSQTVNGPQQLAVLFVTSGPDGSQRIVCDELGGAFVRDVAEEAHVSIGNPDEALFDAFGHTRDEFEAVLGEFAKGASPHATKATWDGEVWLDFNAGTKLTNFTLDDAANTPVTVVDDGSGELTFR